jgi:tetratricopeptide (TPR) repeat protein
MSETNAEAKDWLDRAIEHETRKELGKAVACYRRAVVAAPKEVVARFRLANLFWLMEKLEESRKEFEDLLAIAPDPVSEAELCVVKGRLIAQQGEWQEAYRLFDQAVDLFQRYRCPAEYIDVLAKAYEGMGNMKYREGQQFTALALYRKALELTEGNRQIQLHNLALCLANVGRKNEAMKVFRQALKYGNDPDCWQAIGDLYMQQEKFKPSIDCYRRALAVDPDHFDSHYGLGYCLYLSGDFDQARLHIERARALGEPNADDMLRDIDLCKYIGERL